MRSSSAPPRPAFTPASRRGRARKAPAFHVSVFKHMTPPCGRDWAELPADAISCILHKLDQVELLLGGVAAACRSWRRAAREEPELWRRIDLRDLSSIPPFFWRTSRRNIMRAALRLSAGQCHTFFGELHHEHLLLLAEGAPLLKSLHLIKCYYLSNEEFANIIEKFHLLEELELLWCLGDTQVLEVFAEVCPGLKHLRLVTNWNSKPYNQRKAHAIARMRGLLTLHIVDDALDNEGLTLILDSCRHLEYLNIHNCWNINMDDSLGAKCARIDVDDYEYLLPYDRNSDCGSLCSCSSWDDYDDLSLSYYLGDDIDDMDEKHGRIIDIKSMCRYLS
uniref:Uncharacterized protein n=1 Tax=Avena sativa TaxID=4498 RepID=A0ACD6AEB2_AVESA